MINVIISIQWVFSNSIGYQKHRSAYRNKKSRLGRYTDTDGFISRIRVRIAVIALTSIE